MRSGVAVGSQKPAKSCSLAETHVAVGWSNYTSVRFGVIAPKDTPAAIIDKLHEAIDAALADPK